MKLKYLAILPLLLTGCDLDELFKPDTPKCNDKEVIKLANEIMTNNFKAGGDDRFFYPSVKSEYELSYSKDTGVRTCSGYVSYNMKSNLTKEQKDLAQISLNFLAMSGVDAKKIPISYTINIYKENGKYMYLVRILD